MRVGYSFRVGFRNGIERAEEIGRINFSEAVATWRMSGIVCVEAYG